jgi:ABC-2 type transport system permease protein
MTGQLLAIDVTEEVLGPDLGGTPLLTTIISEEIERSVHALLVTPATVADVFTAKGVAGISLAFRQAALFMAIVGGLNQQSLVV